MTRGLLAMAAVLACAPLVSQDAYFLNLLVLMLFYVVLGLAWNILGGFAGQHSLGHAAFLGLGAYCTLLLWLRAGWPPWLGLLVGVAVSLALGYAVGRICFRLKGAYFTLATLAAAEVLRIVVTAAHDVTGGAEGLLVPPGQGIESKTVFFYVFLALAAASLGLCQWMHEHRMGYYLAAVREDQDAAEALGIDSAAWKLRALMLSAALTAVAGAVYALYLRYIDPDTVLSLPVSVDMVLICLLGGMGTVRGPIYGAILMTLVSELFRVFLGRASLLMYGVLVIVVILYLPGGVSQGLRRIKL